MFVNENSDEVKKQCCLLLVLVIVSGSALAIALVRGLQLTVEDALAKPKTYSCDDNSNGFNDNDHLRRQFESAKCELPERIQPARVTIKASYFPPQPTTFITPASTSSAANGTVVLHFVACGSFFTFINFLSVKSAFVSFRPNIVHIYTQSHFRRSPSFYEWLDDVYKMTPFVFMHKTPQACLAAGLSYDYDTLLPLMTSKTSTINILMKGNIIASQMASQLATHLIFTDVEPNKEAATKIEAFIGPVQFLTCCLLDDRNVTEQSLGSDRPKCLRKLDSCYYVNEHIEPRDVLVGSDNRREVLMRGLYVGNEDVICPVRYSTEVIPRVGHYVRFNRVQISFSFYLSILSLLYVVKVKCVVIHGNLPPTGPYWEDLQQSGTCVRWQYWPLSKDVWRTRIRPTSIEHMADVARAEIFVRYGGLHVDPDVYFVRPLPDNIWRYEAVIGLDAYRLAPGLSTLPETLAALVNLGVVLSMPGSRFFRLYQASQQNFYDRYWIYNSGIKPSLIFDRNPTLALLLPNLQAICNAGICYPAWARTNEDLREFAKRPFCLFDQTYSFHLVHPEPSEYDNSLLLRNSTSMYAHIASVVLNSANTSLDHIESMLTRV